MTLMRARTDEEKHGVGLFMRLLRVPQAIHYGRRFEIFSKYYEASAINPRIIFKSFYISLRMNKPEKLLDTKNYIICFETCNLQ